MDPKKAIELGRKIAMTPRLINKYRQLYNELCRKCQQRTAATEGQLRLEYYCDECRPKAKKKMEQVAKMMGMKVKE